LNIRSQDCFFRFRDFGGFVYDSFFSLISINLFGHKFSPEFTLDFG